MNNFQTYAKFRSEGTPSTPSWATNFAKSTAPKIENYYLSNYKDYPKIHLDLACGTGELCNYLQEKNFSCFGIDKDEYAIIEAKKKKSGAVFECQDFFNFKKNETFTSVSAIHDVVNSIHQEEKLIKFFDNCHSLISENGFLIFDLITPLGFETWNDTQVQTRSDFLLIQKTFYKEETKVGLVQLSGFIKEKNSEKYNRFEISDTVRNYDINWIEDKLKKSGFCSIELHNYWSDLVTNKEFSINNSLNIFIIAKK